MSEAERNCLCSLLIFVVFSEEISFFFLIGYLFGGCLTASSFFNIFKFFVYCEIFIGIMLIKYTKNE